MQSAVKDKAYKSPVRKLARFLRSRHEINLTTKHENLFSDQISANVSSQKGGDKSAQAEAVTRRASGGSRIRLELPRT